MRGQLVNALVIVLALAAAGCSAVARSQGVSRIDAAPLARGPNATTTTSTTTVSTALDSNPPASGSTTARTPTSSTPSTPATTTVTEPLDVFDPACVVRVEPGVGLLEIVDRFDDDTVDAQTVLVENDLTTEVLVVDQLVDVCVDNGLNDIDGSTRLGRNEAIVAREVEAQQRKLNELFAGYGIRELLVDGISGPVTRQRLCAFRLAAGLPVSTADMAAGSEEEQVLMATESLPTPFTSAILSERWIVIDRTCQIMFVGTGIEGTDFVFPTSTGHAGYRTRTQDRSPVFKYNPASRNGGWHNSLTYPAAGDNPLNGNMYKPLYFDNGQAIHGANNVPRSPASKGCARLRVEHQNMLIDWLGLGGTRSITHNTGRINVTVNVQGAYER